MGWPAALFGCVLTICLASMSMGHWPWQRDPLERPDDPANKEPS